MEKDNYNELTEKVVEYLMNNSRNLSNHSLSKIDFFKVDYKKEEESDQKKINLFRGSLLDILGEILENETTLDRIENISILDPLKAKLGSIKNTCIRVIYPKEYLEELKDFKGLSEYYNKKLKLK
jgi:hypothetical protein